MTTKIKPTYEELYDFDLLYNSYVKARKNKRYRKDVLKFTDNLEENLINIQNKLIYKDVDENIRINTKGMPIGNLTSQMFANIYLNELDQFAKRKLRAKYYIRYMDDFLILGESKEELKNMLNEIEMFLTQELNLNLNNKTRLFPVNQGIEFVGYRIWSTHTKLRKQTTKRIKSKLKYLKNRYKEGKCSTERISHTLNSYRGILKHCDSYNLEKYILRGFVLKRDDN